MIIGYLRVSTDGQDLDNQRYELLKYAQEHKLNIDAFRERVMSSRKSTKERKIDELLEELKSSDTLIVSELSRLGRSTGEVITTINLLHKKKVNFIAIKQKINVSGNGNQDMTSKIMVTMFSLFAELERDLISERTKMGLARARAEGKLIGRKKGSRSSKLDVHKAEIKNLFDSGVSQASLSKRYGVGPSSMQVFLITRGIKQGATRKRRIKKP